MKTLPSLLVFSFYLSTFFFSSCGDKSDILIDEQRSFPNDVWNRVTPETFEIDVPDASDYFNIDLSVTVDTALYRYNEMPFYMDIYSPDGTRRHLTPQFLVKENGRWKGESKDGYREVTSRVQHFFFFNQNGTHRIEVRQATSQYDLEGIHSYGIRIEKADLDLEKIASN